MKDKMVKLIKRYREFLLLLIISMTVLIVFPKFGRKAFQLIGSILL